MDKEKSNEKSKKIYEKPTYESEEIFEKMSLLCKKAGDCSTGINKESGVCFG